MTETGACDKCGQPLGSFECRSGNNAGRKFLKCVPCDLWVKWEDGQPSDQSNGPRNYDSYHNSRDGQGGEVLDVREVLLDKFGHRVFRQGQEEVVRNAMSGRDVFVLMPTGGGKSLCYQLPAFCQPGLTVVFSPLISLIQDQVDGLTAVNIEAAHLSSHQDYETEGREVMNKLYRLQPHGGMKLLYITPEKLARSDAMVKTLQRLAERRLLSRFVIDEAHCISQWGESSFTRDEGAAPAQ